VALHFSGVNFVSLNFIDYVSMALCMGDNRVGDTSDLLDLPQEMGLARRGSFWRLRLESSVWFAAVAHPNCVCSQELHLRQEDAYSDGMMGDPKKRSKNVW